MNQPKWHAQLAFFSAKRRGKRGGGGDRSNEGGGESHSGTTVPAGARFNNRAERKERPGLQMRCYLQSPRAGRAPQKV